MPSQAPRKTGRNPGGPPPRRRPVAGSRARRPSGDAETEEATQTDEAPDVGTSDSSVSLDKAKVTPSSTRPRPTPRPAPSPVRKARTSKRSLRLPKSRPLLGLIAATVALVVVVGVLGWFTWQQKRTDEARTSALAAARSHAQTILSYNYTHIDADIAKGKAATTGKFRDEYAKTTSTVVKPTAVQYKAIVSAEVKAASVRSASPEEVVVLLFVNQRTTSTRVTGPKEDQSRVRMTLVKRGDDWLVSKIDAL